MAINPEPPYEARLSALSTTLTQGVWVLSRQGNLLEASPGWTEFTGADPSRGGSWIDSLRPRDPARIAAQWGTARARGESLSIAFRALRADGEQRHVVVHLSPIHDAGGTLREWIGALQDVNERIETASALEASEAQYRVVTDACPFMISYLDRSQRYRLVNQPYADHFGVSKQDLIGKTIKEVLGEAAAGTESYVAAVLAGQEVVFENQVPSSAGVQTMIARYLPRTEAGVVIGFYAFVQNVTQARLLAQEHAQADRLAGLGRLARGIAHDLNNYLTVLSAGLDAIETVGEAGFDIQEPAAAMRAATQAAQDLSHQLLDFSRGQEVIRPAPVDLGALLGPLAALLRTLLGETIALEVDIERPGWWVEADACGLRRLIVNLASNARHAMPEGGRFRLRVRHRHLDDPGALPLEPGDYLVLTAADDGAGIPAETLDHIFELFHTTRTQSGGTGLGLTNCREIVSQAGGHIGVKSEEGHGTEFTVFLPRCPEPSRPFAQASADAPCPRRSPQEASVLLVDDQALVLQTVKRILSAHGYQVLTATDGVEALDLLATFAIDIVVSDLEMPRMNGTELARSLGSSHPHLPVILTSGRSTAVPEGSSVVDVLTKPYSSQELVRSVKQALRETPHPPTQARS